MTANQSSYLKVNRLSYIIEAAVEYFISLLITDTFVSNLLLENGLSAAHTGIIIQLASFAFIAQLFSAFYRKKGKMKTFVTVMHLANQLLFAFLYMVPGINIPQSLKITLIVLMFLVGHIIANIISPYKLSWLMSFVDDSSRGKFTANKEIVSLLTGTIFQLVMANRVDHYMKAGEYNVAFNLCAITILVLAIIHFLCLIVVKDGIVVNKEDKVGEEEKNGFFGIIKEIAANKAYLKVLLAVIIWHIVTGISVSFYGAYKLKTLDFTITGSIVLACVSAVTRAVVSRKFGKYADKNSWAKLLYICFFIVSAAFLANTFVISGQTTFNIGTYCLVIDHNKLMFIAYSVIHGIAMAGINGGLMNIMFDYVPHSRRSAALGISNSVGGLISFFAALVGGWLLASIQKGDDKAMLFFDIFGLGFGMYGQQVLSLISFAVCIVLLIYMKTIVLKISKK